MFTCISTGVLGYYDVIMLRITCIMTVTQGTSWKLGWAAFLACLFQRWRQIYCCPYWVKSEGEKKRLIFGTLHKTWTEPDKYIKTFHSYKFLLLFCVVLVSSTTPAICTLNVSQSFPHQKKTLSFALIYLLCFRSTSFIRSRFQVQT